MKKLIAVCTMIFMLLPAFAQDKDAILGKWESEHGSGRIEIYKKGENYFGKLIWLKEPVDENGKPKKDIYNPSEELRSKPVIGLDILKDFQYNGDGVWDDGTVYNPKTGKSYSCKMWLEGRDKLNIRGFMGFSLIGKTEKWTRVP